ncbi:Tfp pilus assembly protein FimT/FimU [Acetonema longum]|uniref:Prepilin-type N-terminal cleavage/methylation domain-containing protein n=1 Tax=Acetonema longum DSM 6540 TaxID=1009370 RepID=F7NPR2_9FIRM|nr:prepilin-type N-terminal cleavage/methylation domain-containing protein [Acetonema longum]EGO61903.1 hypothetical protein ALO_20547 [Acetonema longum DSM 6540]
MKIGNGFTFIEMMVVISILSIVSLFALPAIHHSLRQAELDHAALNLQADLRWIQQMALDEPAISDNFQLIFDAAALNQYWVMKGTQVLKKVRFPEGVRLSYQPVPAAVYFQVSGAPGKGGQTLSLTNRRSILYVIIEGAVGRVRISDTRPERK